MTDSERMGPTMRGEVGGVLVESCDLMPEPKVGDTRPGGTCHTCGKPLTETYAEQKYCGGVNRWWSGEAHLVHDCFRHLRDKIASLEASLIAAGIPLYEKQEAAS